MISFSTASCYNTKNILLDTRGSTPMSQLQANHFSHITLRPYTPTVSYTHLTLPTKLEV